MPLVKRTQPGWRILAALCLLASAGGCGDGGIELVPVSGVVLLDGKPLEEAGVVFVPGHGPIATGTTDSEGRFTVVTTGRPGAIPGEHKVTVALADHLSGVANEATEDGLMGRPIQMNGPKKPALPLKFADPQTTDLTRTVSREGENTFEINLVSE